MKRALLSVTDKSGISEFAQALVALGYEILSTGGTKRAIAESGIPVTDVADVTGFPEMLEGRLKTLHPLVHGGLLGDTRLEEHRQQMAEANIQPIDLLCVNLYAFEATVSQPHTLAEAIESIDIGGPAMIRAASKNFANVTVVVDPSDYEVVLASIRAGSEPSLRPQLMAKAFQHTAYYDSMIAQYFAGASRIESLPDELTIGLRKKLDLRYGENPHQKAALYVNPLSHGGVASATQLSGKELSYNNILDGDAAWELVCDLPPGSCAIIKHGNPCGVAIGDDLGQAYRVARTCDPISAFGGIAAFHGRFDLAAAGAVTEKGNFLEVIIAVSYAPEAVELIQSRSGWGENVRLLECKVSSSDSYRVARPIRGGALVQDSDEDPTPDWNVVTSAQPSENEFKALQLQWTIAQHVKSNAIVVGNENQLLGVGAGQMNRVQSVRLALEQAGEGAVGAVLASDAFFPFSDSIEVAAAAGIKAIIQPGGSKKDAEVIAKANELGISMVFTGVRHFRH
jgi:phosphoribosylaminoimidazolecarboxamide formyltransferase/IMP cyclohydrolase